MDSKDVGVLGEKIAERFLKNKGYQILDKNYCFRLPGSPQKGEIDIIAKKEDFISFVEVKTLKNSGFLPEDKVNFSKKMKIVNAAESWMGKNKIPLDSKWQMDVISIKIEDKKAKVSHFQNAFSDF